MAPKKCSPFALFLVLNILLFAFVSASGNVSIQCPPKPKPTPTPNPPKPKPTPTPSGGCPRNALKLGVCSSVLSGLFNFTTGVPSTPCCTFMDGLVDYDVAICVCTALKANIMGFPINIPISFTKLLNFCSRQAPSDFHCLPDKN